MGKGLFITGTGTDIGKTYVTGLIVKKLNNSGISAGYYKAAMSGNRRRADLSLIPGDAVFVKEMSSISQPLDEMCPYVYEHAYSPHLAARIEGGHVSMQTVKDGYEKVLAEYDYVTVEGSGGILCPLEADNGIIMLEDVIKELGLGTVIVADAGLGTINAVVLTVEYMKSRKLEIKGIIYNNYILGDVMHDDNIVMCEKLTGIPTLAKITPDAGKLDMSIEKLTSLYDSVGV